VLLVGDALVKQFKVPALNQELILTAFEEEKWPVRMDDPLPQTPQIEPKRRLRDAIHRLNGGQLLGLIRFHTNAYGNAVYWHFRWLPPAPSAPHLSHKDRSSTE